MSLQEVLMPVIFRQLAEWYPTLHNLEAPVQLVFPAALLPNSVPSTHAMVDVQSFTVLACGLILRTLISTPLHVKVCDRMEETRPGFPEGVWNIVLEFYH